MRAKFPRRQAFMGVAVAGLMSIGLAACGGGGGGSGSSNTVTVWSSVDPAVFAGLKKEITAEAKKQGITVNMQRVSDINTLIMTKIQAGDTPDIATIPQPGVVADIVKRGAAKPLDGVVDVNALKSTMTPGTLDAGTVDGKLYGLLVSMNVKSVVYYPKQAWDKGGYQVPKTIPDLEALTQQLKSDGTTPWCFSIGSGDATGWPATDWLEQLVADYGGADQYNQWVTHQIPFSSSLVKQAAGEFEKLVLADGNSNPARSGMASTDFTKADDPMWESKPGCMLLKQGNFIISPDFLPSNIASNVDQNIGVFGFPPAQTGGENPVVGGGDLAVMFNDSSQTQKVMKIMADKQVGVDAAPSSSFISPFTDFDMSLYPNDLTRSTAKVAYGASTFLFDGSDQMPGQVGAGSFWKDMTAWISGGEDLDTALKNIDDSWPTS